MIEIDIDPVLKLGPVGINWYGFALAMGLVSVIVLSIVESKRITKSLGIAFNLDGTLFPIVWAIIGGVIGGRLFYIIDNWQYYLSHPHAFFGLVYVRLIGVIAGAVAGVLIYVLLSKPDYEKLTIGQGADVIAPGAMLGLAVSRLSCFVQGCCYGIRSELPWAVVYLNTMSAAPLGEPVHPVQMYHVLWNLSGFIIIWRLRGKFKQAGMLFLFMLAYYAAGDFGIRFLRDDQLFLFGLQQAQVADIIMLAIIIPWLIFLNRQASRIATS